MDKTINITSSNIYPLKKDPGSGRRYRPYSSKLNKKKSLVRIISAGNINPNYSKNSIFTNYYNLPSLNNNNSIIIKRQYLNNSIEKKIQFKIDLEKLNEQNTQYKKIIRKLQSEIKLVKNNTEKKKEILNTKNDEIENILRENKDKDDFIPLYEKTKFTLVKKMRNQIKNSEKELNEQISKNLQLKKNMKLTKNNEILIEEKIYNGHKEKILLLLENSKQFKKDKSREFVQNEILNNNIYSQQKIIYNFEREYKELENEEEFLKNEIIKYENILNKMTNQVKIINLKHISLKDQNMKLKKEKNNFIKKNGKVNNYSLDKLKKELNKAKNEYFYSKLKNKNTMEKLINLKKNFNKNFEQYKNINNKMNLFRNNFDNIKFKSIQNNNIDDLKDNKYNNGEEYLKKLKIIYQQNREKENELEQGLFLYQKTVKSMNDGEGVNLTEIKESILNNINNNGNDYKNDINMINNDNI